MPFGPQSTTSFGVPGINIVRSWKRLNLRARSFFRCNASPPHSGAMLSSCADSPYNDRDQIVGGRVSGYDTNLAAEYYVLSCLHRIGSQPTSPWGIRRA